MVDVHSHIVFGVDDGSKTIEQSVEIIKEGYEAGFKKIIATPHYIEGYYEKNTQEIQDKIEQIKQKLAEINCPIEILQANEIYITDHINELIEEKKASSINSNRYVLFELPLNAETMNLNRVVYSILEKGRIPILAHPERYPFVQKDPNKLIPLIENGVLLQCNYGSIVGQYKKEAQNTMIKMLEHNMVHLLGSDVHRPQTIYPRISESIDKISEIIGEDALEELTTLNPEKIIEGKRVEIEDPIQIKTNFFKKFFN